MDREECSFRPQINSRSRRLARHAPSLRERQEQEEEQRLRYSASREQQQQPPRSSPARLPSSTSPSIRKERTIRSPAAPPSRSARATASSTAGEATDDEAVHSVWELWRAVVAGEDGGAAAADVRPAPAVVSASTIRAMLKALGIGAPQHAALIDKFLLACGIGRDDAAATGTVEADRFAYVFAKVWKAAVTNRARWNPTPVRAAMAQPSDPRAAAPSPAESTSEAPDGNSPSGDESADVGGDDDSSSSSSSNGGSASSDEDSFLHTNFSRGTRSASPASPSWSSSSSSATEEPEQLSPPPKAALLTPPAADENPGLSLSPEPRDPQETSSTVKRRPPPRQQPRRSPFSASPAAPLRAAASSSSLSMRREGSGSVRVLPQGSHLLTSTTSTELKKATKRAPGGLMRECTFTPKINNAPCGSQLSCWADGVGGAVPAPMAPGFDTAVRRMIAARQHQHQQQQQQQVVRRADPQPLLYVDVDLPGGDMGRIALCRGADVAAVAREFGAQHRLSARLRERLENVLRDQLLAFS